jgi:MoaA/NifB/PqqE/SkfB family radical SAM enzyme
MPRDKTRAYTELCANFLIDALCVRVRSRRIRPLITNFYVTKRCNLRCRYCYPPGDEEALPVEEMLGLLAKIRPHNPAVNLTGGEPLMVEDLERLLVKANELRFHPIILSTNGLLLDRIIPVLDHIHHLVISLDSLDPEVNDRISGVAGVTSQIISNVKRCAALTARRNVHLSLHAVLAPETLAGIPDLVEFCQIHGIALSVSPEHGRFAPHPNLAGNSDYVASVDRLIRSKSAGKPIACSNGYLRAIRAFSSHRCYPFVSPRVEPDGRVYFPCQRIASRAVYLQEYGSLVELMRREFEWIEREECRRRCYLACYLEVEQYLWHPLSLIGETRMRQWISGARTAQQDIRGTV